MHCTELAIVSFAVYDEELVTEDDFIAQYAVRFTSIHEGASVQAHVRIYTT